MSSKRPRGRWAFGLVQGQGGQCLLITPVVFFSKPERIAPDPTRVREGERSVGEWCGPVVTSEGHEEYRGAERCTNNTGELSGIIAALELIAEMKPRGSTLIRFDSE